MSNKIMQRASRGRPPRAAKITFDLDTVHGRLAWARSQIYPSASAAARDNGWVVSTTAQHENGDRELTTQFAVKYSIRYNVSLDFLFFGKTQSPVMGSDSNQLVKSSSRLNLSDIALIERLRVAMSNRRRGDASPDDFPIDSVFWVTMPDRSMECEGDPQAIKQGDELKCSILEDINPSDIVLAIVDSQKSTLIRKYKLLNLKPRTIELEPLNKDNPAVRFLDNAQGVIIARIIGRFTPL